jgi:hypothetical protein
MIWDRMMRRQSLWTVVLAVVSGCTGTGVDEGAQGPDFSNLVPVSGVITLNGAPLAGAVVTFLPTQWAPGVGETNEKGEYDLSTASRPGLSPGDYKVAISLLLSAEGEPQGIGPRSSLAQPPSMLTSKEYLPRHYADLGTSKLTAHVDKKGGTFNFDVEAPGLVLPPRPASGAKETGEEAAAEAGDEPTAKPASPAR